MRTAIEYLTIADWYAVFAKHLHWSRANNRISGNPQWDAGGLNVIGIRMNPLEHFYVQNRQDWNDWLVLIMNNSVHLFPCTVDPAMVRVNPAGIAHLNEGCWDAYVRGYHKSRSRRALVQRTNPVRVTRTDERGLPLADDWGYFGINIHNAAGLRKPSAGCTVIKPDRGFMLRDKAYLRFRDILNAAPDRPSRTYCLISKSQLAGYGWEVE